MTPRNRLETAGNRSAPPSFPRRRIDPFRTLLPALSTA